MKTFALTYVASLLAVSAHVLDQDESAFLQASATLERLQTEEVVDERYFGDVSKAKEVLFQKSEEARASENQRFYQSFQQKIDEAIGQEGEVVVSSLKADKIVCEGRYLHETFVHVDKETASFVCRPCHAACIGGCMGPSKEDCFEQRIEEVSFVSRSSARTSFSESIETFLSSHALGLDDGEGDGEAKEEETDMTECLADGSCSMTEERSEGKDQYKLENTTSEVVLATTEKGALTDPTELKHPVQVAVNKGLKDAGFLPGVTEEVENEEIDVPDATESGTPDSDELDSSIVQDKSLLQLANKGLSSHQKNRIKGLLKDYARAEAKKRAKDYAKSELKAWIQAQEGDCLDAVDTLIGASVDMYACFKEKFGAVQTALCKPPELHGQLTSLFTNVNRIALVLKSVSGLLKNVPYVGGVCKKVYDVSTRVSNVLKPRIDRLNKMNYKNYGNHDDSGCCHPQPKPTKWPWNCNAHPGAWYRCGNCGSGSMCSMQKGCNTLNKFEEKLDAWKEKYYDPLVEKFAEAAQHVQAGNNAINNAAWLFTCNQLQQCSQLKALADKVKSAVESHVLTPLRCPWTWPVPSLPNLGFLSTVVGWLNKIAGVLEKIKGILWKQYCVTVPIPQAEWRRGCVRICLPCCHWSRRRRWVGGLSCRSCCHNVCTPYLHVWFKNVRYCFSAQKIIEGLSGLIMKAFGPIVKIIQAAIDFVTAPIMNLFQSIIDKIIPDINIPLPSIPSFNFNMPSLPTLSCGALQSFGR